MPLSKVQKEEALNKLRKERSLYSEKVSEAMKLIEPEYLSSESAVKSFRERIRFPYYEIKSDNNSNIRKSKDYVEQCKTMDAKYFARYIRYTEKDKAERIGVTHSIINKLENTMNRIDPFYLECYSLLFNVSPLYLAGKVDNPGIYSLDKLIEPMYFIDPKIISMSQMIVMNLYKSDNGRELLNDFYKISDIDRPITTELRRKIKECLMTIPVIKKNFKEFTYLHTKDIFDKFLLLNQKKEDYLIHTANIISHMGELDYELICLMAFISEDDSILHLVHVYLRDGGFFNNNRAFSKNDG